MDFAAVIFKRETGIPKGGNAGTALADITHSVLEFKYSYRIVYSGLLTVRYINDVLTVSKPRFSNIAKYIYIYGNNLEINVEAYSRTAPYSDVIIKVNVRSQCFI